MGSVFWDGFDDDMELIVYDEFCGSSCQFSLVKKILDGQTLTLNVKGSSFVKSKNLPVIMCSNYPPEEIYHGLRDVDKQAFISRLYVVYVGELFTIFNKI